jgi:hypothetical protein
MNKRPTFPHLVFTLVLVLSLAAAAAPALAQAGRYAVQFVAFPTRAEADEKVDQLKAQGIQAYIVKSNVPGKGLFYRVRTGSFATRAAAEQSGQKLKAQGAVTEYYIATYETPEPEAPVKVANNAVPAAPAPGKEPVKEPAKAQPKTSTLIPTSTTLTKPAANTTPANNVPANPPTASNTVVNNSPANAPAVTPASNPAGNSPVSVIAGYTRYQDQTAGYSFEHPQYWVGGALNPNEMQSQKVSAGAMFKSNEDAAFLNAIWNKLDKANSPDHDNDMIVDLILKSMGTGNGTQNMQAISRRVISDNQQIKTFLDLKAAFQVPNQPAPLDFIGKGVIIRGSKGILLLVAFYSKDAPQTVAMTADHIIQTARTPE